MKRENTGNSGTLSENYKAHGTKHMTCSEKAIKKERFLRNDDSSLITTNKELASKWGNYFDKLLNCEELDEAFYFYQETQ